MTRWDHDTQSWTSAPVDYGKQVPVRFNRKTELPLLDALVAKAKKNESWDNKASRSSVILKLVLAAAKGLKPVVVEEKKPAVDERQKEMFELPKPKKARAAAARKTKRRSRVRKTKRAGKAKKAGKK